MLHLSTETAQTIASMHVWRPEAGGGGFFMLVTITVICAGLRRMITPGSSRLATDPEPKHNGVNFQQEISRNRLDHRDELEGKSPVRFHTFILLAVCEPRIFNTEVGFRWFVYRVNIDTISSHYLLLFNFTTYWIQIKEFDLQVDRISNFSDILQIYQNGLVWNSFG